MGNCDSVQEQSNIWVNNIQVPYNQFCQKFDENLKSAQQIPQLKVPKDISRKIQQLNISFKAEAKIFTFSYPYTGYIIKQIPSQHQTKTISQQIFDGNQAGVYIFGEEQKGCTNYYFGKLANHKAIDQTGIYIFQNGDHYSGNVHNSNATGNGTFTNENKTFKYEGHWKDNLPEGEGKQQTQDYTYTGTFSKGTKSGNGYLKYKAEDVIYNGNFVNNIFQGEGTLIKGEKQIFKGQFKNGMQNGKGKWLGQSGEEYQGQFLDGKKHGKGKYAFADKTIYEGEFKNGFLDGKGSILKGQNKKQGIWMQNKNMIIFD